MTVILISVLTVVAMAIGFAFGRSHEREQWTPKPKVVDLHSNEWRRVS